MEMHGDAEKPVTRAALLADVMRARHVLRTYNVHKGDRVALYANNSARGGLPLTLRASPKVLSSFRSMRGRPSASLWRW